ncbi:SpoVR family protein [Shigella flexneri]
MDSGINPYVLGFAMFEHIKRICQTRTEEDKYASRTSPVPTGWNDCTSRCVILRTRSISQFLSPKSCVISACLPSG